MLENIYRSIMDADSNPLRKLPRVVKFQLMSVLSFMWTTVFTIWVGINWVFGPSMAAHIVLLIAVFFTADIFEKARQWSADNEDDHGHDDAAAPSAWGDWARERLTARAPASFSRRG
jgi:membrane protein YdbS with pleckstrin-like domain